MSIMKLKKKDVFYWLVWVCI